MAGTAIKLHFPHDQGKVRFCLGSLSRLPESSPFESWGLQWGLGGVTFRRALGLKGVYPLEGVTHPQLLGGPACVSHVPGSSVAHTDTHCHLEQWHFLLQGAAQSCSWKACSAALSSVQLRRSIASVLRAFLRRF